MPAMNSIYHCFLYLGISTTIAPRFRCDCTDRKSTQGHRILLLQSLEKIIHTPGRAVYGYFPSISDTPAGRNSGGHCPNERVALYSVSRALQLLYELVTRLCL
jgi:hypothetical protein